MQNVVIRFLAHHVVESIKKKNLEDLVKNNLEFFYLRDVSRWPEVLGESEVILYSPSTQAGRQGQ